MIRIIEIVKINQRKYKIITDCKEIAFVVYKGDLLKYGLKADAELPQEVLDEFYAEVLLPRAKRRGMYLLGAREYTACSLSDKLKRDGYPEPIILQVISCLQKYRYLDDDRYIKAYIRTYAKGKSICEMKRYLHSKGIGDESIEKAMRELDAEELPDEKRLIERYLEKRKFNPENATLQERNKMFQYLRSKGFDFDLIASSLNNGI